MKKFINCLKIYILFVYFFSCVSESVAQSYLRIEYPYTGSSTVDYVCIKSIEFSSYQTRIDFIACHTGHYIFLEKPSQRNAMYIRIGNRKYKLRSTYGIASTDRVTLCQPGQLLEFTAIFDPIPDKERDNFDLIEGIDGTWNFYKVSISKYLSRHKVPNWVTIDRRNREKVSFKEETIEYPYVERQSHPYLIMTKIEKLFNCTKIYFYYRTPYEYSSWMNFNKDTFLRTSDGEKYDIISSEGIPLSPDVYNFNKIGESVNFCLTFPKIPNNIKSFTLCEPTLDGFFFYNVEFRSDFKSYLAKCNGMNTFFNGKIQVEVQEHKKENTPQKTKTTIRKKLKKDPNFKID